WRQWKRGGGGSAASRGGIVGGGSGGASDLGVLAEVAAAGPCRQTARLQKCAAALELGGEVASVAARGSGVRAQPTVGNSSSGHSDGHSSASASARNSKSMPVLLSRASTKNSKRSTRPRSITRCPIPNSDRISFAENKAFLLDRYAMFRDKYANVPFTSKKDKYIKFTKDDVERMLDEFFRGIILATKVGMTRTMVRLPEPQVHRYRKHTARKLQKFEKANKTPYLMVPRFFDMYHPTTTWLINTVVSENEKELDRVLSDKVTNSLLRFDPDPNAIQQQHTMMKGNKQFVVTKSKYFQILDRPEMYDTSSSAGSLFGRHTVMYLTPLGLAIYLGKMKAARQLSTYDILHLMLVHNNWFPMEPFRLVYRKRFVETNMWFDDFMDYAFYILFTKRSSMNVARLASAVLKRPTEHFNLNYLCQPTRAMKITLVRMLKR
uniref:Exo70 domain-containing protein n=1 Tax=Macrostomum lignano TaxID=282301 RepID=A0A1I8JMY5_9PLAT